MSHFEVFFFKNNLIINIELLFIHILAYFSIFRILAFLA